jgi:prepilin-type N-terminal cleavage/methylation domain-containing protein
MTLDGAIGAGRRTNIRGAFTLIELLVVVSIVALLLTILLPSLRTARGQARRVVCGSQLRSIGTAIWNYWTVENGRVPYVETPMTNGGALTETGPASGFGDATSSPDDLNPFDRVRWPMSLPNVLMPAHLGTDAGVFVCPSAVNGWPGDGRPYEYTYRSAAANQPNGAVSEEGSYFRENFGFMDGRMLRSLKTKLTGNAIENAQALSRKRGTFLRDFVRRDPRFRGPHRGGVNVLDRTLAVEFRDRQTTINDLATFGSGVSF